MTRILMLASFGLEIVECGGALARHREFDKSLALVHGLAGHSGAVMGEAYRREGSFVMDYLVK